MRTPPLDPTRGWYFEVKPGDSVESIASAAGISIQRLATENKLGNPALMYEGQLLWIPPKSQRQPAAEFGGSASTAVANVGPLPLDTGGAEPKPIQIDGASVAAHNVVKSVPAAPNAAKLNFRWPVDPSACQVLPTKRGLDLVADEGTPVCAVQSGSVLSSGQLHGFGNLVLVDHGNGYTSVYTHLKHSVVRDNQKVKKGQIIGYVGSSEAEKAKLYFEIRYGRGKSADPINPMAYLPAIN